MAKLLGPSDESAVTSDFVVLHGLGVRHDRSVQNGFIVDLAGGFVRFFDEAVDGGAIGARWLLAQLLEDLLEALDLLFVSSRCSLRPRVRSLLVA